MSAESQDTGNTSSCSKKSPEKPKAAAAAALCDSAVMQEWYHTKLFQDHEDMAGLHR